MDMRQKYVYEVWKQKSFTKAAEKLFISQPSLSATVKKEEQKIGASIFDRSSSPLNLTPAGELYIKYLEEIRHSDALFEQNMWELQGLKRGNIRIGSSNLGMNCILPGILKNLIKEYPEIQIELTESTSLRLMELLLSGELDLVIDTFSGNEPGVDSTLLIENHVLLAVPENIGLSKDFDAYEVSIPQIKEGLSLAKPLPDALIKEALSLPFVLLKEENSIAQRSLNFFRQYEQVPHVLFSLDQLETALQYASAGIGLTFLTDPQIRYGRACKNLRFFTLPDSFEQRNICMAVKAGRELSPSMKLFLEQAPLWLA